MSLLFIQSLSEHVRLGLWKIDEVIDDYYLLYPHLSRFHEFLEKNYRSDVRKKEFLSVRALLFDMTHDEKSSEISYEPSGKPFLNDYDISISHTKGFAAVILSQTGNVAVDIEYYSARVQKIADRFIRSDEQADSLNDKLVNWCAKEVMYKFFSEENLQYFEMRVHSINENQCKVDDLKTKKTIDVYFNVNSLYTLAYTY
jgi:phosphopantetheinyl transferase